MKHHHPTETTFMQRTGQGMKRHWAMATITVILSTVTSTVVPLLEQWHSDKQISAEIDKSEATLQRQIDDMKQSSARLWEQIARARNDLTDTKYALALRGISVVELPSSRTVSFNTRTN